MREDLLGYLLGALDAPQRDRVERLLESDPDLRVELDQLRSQLEFLEEIPCDAPPPNLASRTSQLVADFANHPAAKPEMPAPTTCEPAAAKPQMSPANEFSQSANWRMADIVVAAGICIAASLLFFPVIANSRFSSHVMRCQENMQQVGLALQQYAEFHRGLFPSVDRDRPYAAAGIYAPLLMDNDFIRDSQRFICPSASDVERLVSWRPPTVEQLASADRNRLHELKTSMGGTYGYQLGYVNRQRYVPPRNRLRTNFAIMADVPGTDADLRTTNHGGRGQNVLFEDGHVEFVTGVAVGRRDDFFRSDRGIVEPGRHQNDAVIARSGVSPFHYGYDSDSLSQ